MEIPRQSADEPTADKRAHGPSDRSHGTRDCNCFCPIRRAHGIEDVVAQSQRQSRPDDPSKEIHEHQEQLGRADQIQHGEKCHQRSGKGEQRLVPKTVSECAPAREGHKLADNGGSGPGAVGPVREMQVL